MRILLLADTGHHTQAVSDHINALIENSQHEWQIENPLMCKILHQLDLSCFDAIGIHYSIKAHSEYYLPKKLQTVLRDFKGVKFIFLQDEYEFVERNITAIDTLKISLLLTLVKPEYHRLAYADPRMRDVNIQTVLTGYVTPTLRSYSALPLSARTVDIFYRSREYPFCLGQLARQRIDIANGVQARASQYQLTTDISVLEADRLYGEKWLKALSTARSVLGTESGASVWDVNGQIKVATNKYLAKRPNASFAEVAAAVFQASENKIPYATISPRFFEAAALKTPMILFPGDYEGILKPGVHYIECQRDFSNFAEVVAQLRDPALLQSLVDRAYQDLIISDRYAAHALSQQVDGLLLECQRQCGAINSINSFYDSADSVMQKKPFLKLQNTLFCITAEIRFMIKNFFLLLKDERFSGMKKFQFLYRGAHRYVVYVCARLKSKSSKASTS